MQLTPGRNIVFQEVMKAHGHFAAEELVKLCQKHARRVSRATIYRSLRELRAAGVIRETAFGEKHQHYEHVYDEKLHHHARCIQCHRVMEFPCMEEDEKYVSILKKRGFHILGHELHFYGLCPDCVMRR
ncbi:MAG: transcriptional repressor [Candidatus Omnitrophica bacterium]|nr:transcriptional repressor [Candidatus Omnitrophota bacterium]